MDIIRAPYNFAPIDGKVFQIDDVDPEAPIDYHDEPFPDGICGTLSYEIEAETPLFVRGATRDEKGPTQFFRTPDNTHAIPGTSVRGMIRSVVEVVSSSRMWLFNDHAYSIRDLTPAARKIYGEHMAQIAPTPSGKREPVAVVSAGWLKRLAPPTPDGDHRAGSGDDVVAVIDVCDFGRVEYDHLVQMAAERGLPFNPGRRQRSLAKYDAWGSDLVVGFKAGPRRERGAKSANDIEFLSEVSTVSRLGAKGSGDLDGHLVFTGQPNEYRPEERGARRGGNAKHHDFVFYRRSGVVYRRYHVTRSQLTTFRQVHAARGQQGRLEDSPNPEWKRFKAVFDKSAAEDPATGNSPDHAVPVFFLPEQGRPDLLRAFGLAMMFRLPYRHTIGWAVESVQGDARNPNVVDLATALFGTVENRPDRTTLARRGRVSFGLARATSKVIPMPAVTATLGTPRASYFPNYFTHADLPSDGLRRDADYKTLMEDGVEVRGFKRYRVQAEQPRAPERTARSLGRDARRDDHNDDVATTFEPLPPGTTFRGTIRLHNVRPWELGSLLWAIDFGGDVAARHLLGLGKSLGYGRIKVNVSAGGDLDRNDGATVELDACRAEFASTMDGHWGGPGTWRASEPVRQVLACATPAPAANLRHMMLRHPDTGNEFVEAKRSGLTLAPAVKAESPIRTRPPAGRGGAASPPPGSPGARPGAPAQPPTAVAMPRPDYDEQFREASRTGAHEMLLRKWMEEGGPDAGLRRAAAMKKLISISPRMRKKMPDVVAWLEASSV